METLDLRQAIETEARRLGFGLFGVTTPDPPPHGETFAAWLAAGRHGEMAYLAAERSLQRRLDPRQIMPECRSILALGMHYAAPHPNPSPHSGRGAIESLPSAPRSEGVMDYPPSPFSPPGRGAGGDGRGRVAAYAWGDDYHDVLPARLAALAAFIERQAGQPVLARGYTDTGPVLERDLAQRAGLGWIGKNTCLINPLGGSYFLLAELLLDIDLPPDLPFSADRCGSCTRCLEACPTGCILPDRTLDARRCISYLTIELKGSIPPDLRPQLGEWVFGCDVCQQVCPWNQRFSEPAAPLDPAFQPRPAVPRPNLAEDLQLTPEAFNRKYKGSPVKRAKRRGYLRNLAVALGNLGDPAYVPGTARSLEDPEALVRAHAAWACGRIGGPDARQALEQVARSEADSNVQAEIRWALEALNALESGDAGNDAAAGPG